MYVEGQDTDYKEAQSVARGKTELFGDAAR